MRKIILLWGTFVVVLVASSPVAAQPARQWHKYRVDVVNDDTLHARWTTIATSDGVVPAYSRLLLEDAAAHRLTVRTSYQEGPGTLTEMTSFQNLATGELLTFFNQNGTLTITLGANQFTVTYDQLAAFGGPDGKELPPDVKAAGATMFSAASQGFRDALENLSRVGCNETSELFTIAVMPAAFLVSGISCVTLPRVDYAQRPFQITPQFDPNNVPPDSFEQQFGQAYFQCLR